MQPWELESQSTLMTHHPQPNLLGQIFGTLPKGCWEQRLGTSKFSLDLKDILNAPGYPGPCLYGAGENVRITEGWVMVLIWQVGMKMQGAQWLPNFTGSERQSRSPCLQSSPLLGPPAAPEEALGGHSLVCFGQTGSPGWAFCSLCRWKRWPSCLAWRPLPSQSTSILY